jgi:CRISPR/Cas system-associated endonuclease Cas1
LNWGYFFITGQRTIADAVDIDNSRITRSTTEPSNKANAKPMSSAAIQIIVLSTVSFSSGTLRLAIQFKIMVSACTRTKLFRFE